MGNNTLRGLRRAYSRLAGILGVTEAVLVEAGAHPSLSTEEAATLIRRVAGVAAWREAAVAPTVFGASAILKRAIRAARQRGEVPKDDETPKPGRSVSTKRKARRRVEEEDDEQREDDEIEDEDDDDEPEDDETPPSSKRSKKTKRSKRTDKTTAADLELYRRVAATTGRPLAEVAKATRAMNRASAVRHGAQPTAAPRRSSKAHRDGITAADRELAARRGLDPAAVARSRRALFGGSK